MSESRSISDDVIDALSAIRAIDSGIDTESPERFHIWNLKHLAEQTLSNALHQVIEISGMAKDIRSTVREVEKGGAK